MCYSNSLTFLNYFFLAYTLLLLSIYNMKEGYLDFVMLTTCLLFVLVGVKVRAFQILV